MIRNLILTVFLLLALGLSATNANDKASADSIPIINAINASGSTIIIEQTPEVENLLKHHKASSNENLKAGIGYRIQIFSDNNIRTAKSNAEYRKRLVSGRMPNMRSYITFESPYWRVRVGDFRTRDEAEEALRKLKSAFPSFAADMRIIRARINASGSGK